ncbi:MAG: MFS transporter [Planctomycetota bacterium]|jgi:MFS family permease
MPQTLERNLACLYVIKMAKWFMLIMPIVALFYTANGLDEFDIYLLQAIYSVSVAGFEIPSGYMADVIGRKRSLILGSVLGTLGFVVYSLSGGFHGFLVAEVILGLGGSFISGSDSALLYDSLAEMKEEKKYLTLEGRITSIGNFAETLAAVGGGLLAAYLSYRAVYVGQAFISALAIPASLLLVEPPREKKVWRPGLAHILSVCRTSLLRDRTLSSTILFSAITGTCTLTMAWTAQVFFVGHGLKEGSITPLWVALNLVVAVGAAYAARLVARIGTARAVWGIMLILPLAYILLGLLPLLPAIGFLMLFYGVRGYATPLLKNFINMNCASDTRATVLSIRNLVIRTSFALMGPFIGAVAIRGSLPIAVIAAGGIFMVLLTATGLFLFAQKAADQ